MARLGATSQLCNSGGTVTGPVDAWKLKGQRGRKLNQDCDISKGPWEFPVPVLLQKHHLNEHPGMEMPSQEHRNPGERSQHWLEPRNKKRCFEADKRDSYQRDSFPARQHTSPILLVGKEWISAQLYLAPVSPASGCHSQAGPTDPMPGPLHLLALQLQAPGSPTQGLGPRSPRCRISDRNRSMPLGKISKS